MRRWLAILGLTALLLSTAPTAEATHYPDALNLSALVDRAERIFLGEVLSRVSGADSLGLIATVYTFRVERLLKGTSSPTVTIKQAGAPEAVEDPATGVVTVPIHGLPTYQPGQRYLLFLNGTSDIGFTSPVGLGYGAFRVLPDGRAVNSLNNAGLLRDMSQPAVTAADAPLRGHTRGPVGLSALIETTSALIKESTGEAIRWLPESFSPSPRHVVRPETARPRGNPSSLFGGRLARWNVPTAANPGGSLAAVPYDLETGPLGNVSNANAVAKVAESFAKWSAPSTTALVVTSAPGSLGVDVNAVCPSPTCYLNWFQVFGDGKNPIIFDTDGSIIQQISGSQCGFGGYGGTQWRTSNAGLTFTMEAYVVLNGAFLGGACGTRTLDQSGGTITHELGHFLGIGHTIVNAELLMAHEPFLGFGVPPCAAVEVMISNGIPGCTRPNVLQKDDISVVSTLYPSASFATTAGRISGRIVAPDGVTPVNCGNVILRSATDPFFDAVATISGISKDFGTPPAGQAGSYDATGLTLGGNYIVGVNQIPSFAEGGSGIIALCDPIPTLPGPEEFYNGVRESAGSASDNPNCFTPVTAFTATRSIDIVLNQAAPNPTPCSDPPLGLTVAVNQATFSVGQTLSLSLGVTSPRLSRTADFYLGTRRPDGSFEFFTSTGGLVSGSLADPRPVAVGVPLTESLATVVPNFVSRQRTGSDQQGTYLFFFAAMDGGQLLGLATVSYSFP